MGSGSDQAQAQQHAQQPQQQAQQQALEQQGGGPVSPPESLLLHAFLWPADPERLGLSHRPAAAAGGAGWACSSSTHQQQQQDDASLPS
jgi:hypothetical protein